MASPNDISKIMTAIAAVRKAVGHVGKDGEVSYPGVHFKFASEGAVTAALRDLLDEHGIVYTQSACSECTVENGITTIRYAFTIYHVSGAVLPEPIYVWAQGNDRDSKGGYGDKGANRTSTQAMKYFLMRLFMLDTGDDPDGDKPKDGAKSKAERSTGGAQKSERSTVRPGSGASEKQLKMLGARCSAKADELLDAALAAGIKPHVQDKATAKEEIRQLAKEKVGVGELIQGKEVDALLKCIESVCYDAKGWDLVIGTIKS